MIRKIIRLFNSIIFTNIKFLFIKIISLNKFNYCLINFISPLNCIDIQGKGKIIFGNKLSIPYKCIFGVRENGVLKIDDGTFINNNCQIISHEYIEIGKNVCIGPNTVIVDHNHSYDKNGVDKKQFTSSKISIGDNVWIGANSVILKGTHIGNNCIIGAGSILNGSYPNNTVVIQKKEELLKNIDIR